MTALPSPSESYWVACGGPPVEGTDDLPPGSVCAACGGVAVRGMTMARWSGAGSLVLDKLKAPHSPHACRGCVWACTWAAPPGRTAKEGQTKGPSPAMYAHVLEWTPSGPRYANASKGEKPTIRAWLAARREHPWWMVVADMGKKQLIPWADWNLAPTARGATVFLDDEPCVPGDLALVDAMMHVLTVGATKATLETGHYTPGEWSRCAADLRAFEEAWGHLRHSAWFRLALWLAQRDEAAVEERMATEKADRDARKAAEKVAKARPKAAPTAAPKGKPRKAAVTAPPTPDDATPPAVLVASTHDEAQGRTEGAPADAHRGVGPGPLHAGDPQRLEPAGPVGPGGEPAPRRRQRHADPRGVAERHAPQATPERPEQGQLGLFD